MNNLECLLVSLTGILGKFESLLPAAKHTIIHHILALRICLSHFTCYFTLATAIKDPPIEDSSAYTGPNEIIWGQSSHLKVYNVNNICKAPLSERQHIHRLQRLGHRHHWETIIPLPEYLQVITVHFSGCFLWVAGCGAYSSVPKYSLS